MILVLLGFTLFGFTKLSLGELKAELSEWQKEKECGDLFKARIKSFLVPPDVENEYDIPQYEEKLKDCMSKLHKERFEYVKNISIKEVLSGQTIVQEETLSLETNLTTDIKRSANKHFQLNENEKECLEMLGEKLNFFSLDLQERDSHDFDDVQYETKLVKCITLFETRELEYIKKMNLKTSLPGRSTPTEDDKLPKAESGNAKVESLKTKLTEKLFQPTSKGLPEPNHQKLNSFLEFQNEPSVIMTRKKRGVTQQQATVVNVKTKKDPSLLPPPPPAHEQASLHEEMSLPIRGYKPQTFYEKIKHIIEVIKNWFWRVLKLEPRVQYNTKQ